MNSRAVSRVIEPGLLVTCAHCETLIRFAAKSRQRRQVIANVYVDGRWDRVETFHDTCYEDAGEPYGPAVEGKRMLVGSRR